jgi:hypothetical protein
MISEEQENIKWNLVFEHQKIRNQHEAEYWKTIAQYKKEQIKIYRQMIIDTIILYLFCLYIMFFCLFE